MFGRCDRLSFAVMEGVDSYSAGRFVIDIVSGASFAGGTQRALER